MNFKDDSTKREKRRGEKYQILVKLRNMLYKTKFFNLIIYFSNGCLSFRT